MSLQEGFSGRMKCGSLLDELLFAILFGVGKNTSTVGKNGSFERSDAENTSSRNHLVL
jgi:hypothetical protein